MLKAATQANRQLAIFSPLGKDELLLKSFVGEEGLSELSRFELNLLSSIPDIDPRSLLGRNVTLLVSAEDLPTRYFNGFVREFGRVDADDRGVSYRAEVVPWLWFLTQTSDCRIFQEKTAPDIIRQIFEDLGFDEFEMGGLTRDYPTLDYCVQYRESDFNFVSRLMEEFGIFYFFRHENGKHTLVLGDSTASYFSISDDEVSIASQSQLGILPTDVFQWQHGKQLLPGRWVATDYNFEKPRRSLINGVPSKIAALQSNGLERFDYPGRFQEPTDARRQVQTRMEQEEARHEWVSAEGVRHTFCPGGTFRVASHPRDAVKGKEYALRRVRYRAGNVGGYTSGSGDAGESEQPWYTQFDAIPKEVVYRPQQQAAKPLVKGPQTATVVGPRGEEIYTDKHGRIKVQFHWDREGSRDERSSCWMRVSQTHAGAGWGAMDLPRIGEEVIVSFLEGDPDRPIVKGRVYNGAARVPFGLPGQMTRSGGKSNTHKGSGFNEVSMDDTAGKEQMRVNAQYNMDTTVGNSQTLKVGVDRTGSIGNNDALTIGNNSTTQVGNDSADKIGADENVIVGNNIVWDAGVAITLKCGASTIHMNQAGVITISGKFVSSLARATNSIIAPMTEIAGTTMLNQAGLICLDVSGIKHIKGKQTSVSGSTVNVKGGGLVIVKGAPIKLGEVGAPVAILKPPPPANGSAKTSPPKLPEGVKKDSATGSFESVPESIDSDADKKKSSPIEQERNRAAIEAAIDASPNGVAIIGGEHAGGPSQFNDLIPGAGQGYDHVAVAYRDAQGNVQILEMTPTLSDDPFTRNFGSPNEPRSFDALVQDYDFVRAVPVNGLSDTESAAFLANLNQLAGEGRTYSFFDFPTLGIGQSGDTCATVIGQALTNSGIPNSVTSNGDINFVRPDQVVSAFEEMNKQKKSAQAS